MTSDDRAAKRSGPRDDSREPGVFFEEEPQPAKDVLSLPLPAELSVLLDNTPATVDWSPRRLSHLYGYWTIATHGKNRGQRRIIVSSLYRTEPKVVSDEMLRYLLWHELLHDLLPGQQHDAEFREMEYRWPSALGLDAEWAGLHDRYLFPENPEIHKYSAHAQVM